MPAILDNSYYNIRLYVPSFRVNGPDNASGFSIPWHVKWYSCFLKFTNDGVCDGSERAESSKNASLQIH